MRLIEPPELAIEHVGLHLGCRADTTNGGYRVLTEHYFLVRPRDRRSIMGTEL